MLRNEESNWRGSLMSLRNRLHLPATTRLGLRDCEDGLGIHDQLRNSDRYIYYSSGQLNNDFPTKLQQSDDEEEEYNLHNKVVDIEGSLYSINGTLDESTHSINKDQKKNVPNKFQPPDGGYGWLVVFASFLIQAVTGSIGYIHGMLYPEFLAAFDAGGVTTAWVSSMQIAIWFIGAMVAGPMVQTIGTKKVCIIGSLTIATSILITSVSQHIAMLYVFYGLTTGIGMSFIFFPAVIVVQQYFVKKRSIAVAIANAGVSFGGFAMPPLCDFLLRTFGWRGNMMIMAGIALNVLVISCAFKPIGKSVRRRPKSSKSIAKDEESQDSKDSNSSQKELLTVNEMEESKNLLPELKIENQRFTQRRESLSLPSSPMLHRMKPDQSLNKLLAKKLIQEKLSTHPDCPKMTLGTQKKELDKKTINQNQSSEENPFLKSIEDDKDDVVSSAQLKIENKSNKLKDSKTSPNKFVTEFKVFLKRLTDFSLLKNPNMTFDMFAYGCFSFGFIVPSMFLPLKARQLDIAHPLPTFLISMIGISDVLGRFVTGFMGQILGQRRLYHYMLSMLIGGLMTSISCFMHNFIGLAIYACIFGLCTGMARAYSSIVLTDMLGLNNLPKAYGFKLFLNGFTVLGSAPFAAFVMEATDSVDISFLIIGMVQAMGGVLILILLILRHCGCAPVRTSWVD